MSETGVMSEPGAETDAAGELERLTEAARDSLTDDIVARLAETTSGAMDLIDQVNRSNLEGALPVISRMIADGDLERIAQLARLIGSAQDALTDDMVGRLAETVGESLSMLDRLNRCGLGRLITVMEHMEASGTLERLGGALLEANEDMEQGEPAAGGLGRLWRLVSDRENQEILRFLFALGKRMRLDT